jgi:hypothetical protein
VREASSFPSTYIVGYCTSGAALLSKAAGLLFIILLIAPEIPFNWRFHNGH